MAIIITVIKISALLAATFSPFLANFFQGSKKAPLKRCLGRAVMLLFFFPFGLYQLLQPFLVLEQDAFVDLDEDARLLQIAQVAGDVAAVNAEEGGDIIAAGQGL